MFLELFLIISVFVVLLVSASFFIVKQQHCTIIERFGKFNRISTAGLHVKIPLLEQISTTLSLRIQQLDVQVETKTKDDVFVTLVIAVQYRVLPEKIYEAFYMLQDPEEQIRAFVFDLVRAQVPSLILDDVFAKKDDIANAIKGELEDPMSTFGFQIIKALITDIDPDANVKVAMNEINTAQRMRTAANERGEAEKILQVKKAEAEAESCILHGKGVAGQRQAIIEGLSSSVEQFTKLTNASHNQVMDMVLLIQYIDTLKEIGANSKSNVVFIPHSPEGISNVSDKLRESLLASDLMKK